MEKPKKKKPALSLSWKAQPRICLRCSGIFVTECKTQVYCRKCGKEILSSHLADRR